MRKNSHRAYVVRLSVAPVVDRYDEDWARLGWVMLRGRAEILSAGTKHELPRQTHQATDADDSSKAGYRRLVDTATQVVECIRDFAEDFV
jgi:hypothetical protein